MRVLERFSVNLDSFITTYSRPVYIETFWRPTHDCVWKIPIAYWSTNRQSEFSRHSHESRAKKAQCKRTLKLAGAGGRGPLTKGAGEHLDTDVTFSDEIVKENLYIRFSGFSNIILEKPEALI